MLLRVELHPGLLLVGVNFGYSHHTAAHRSRGGLDEYHGEVEHRDSSGGGGRIGPGDVQGRTAAGGIVHEEFHGREFARQGGMFEMVQLWVNLPAKDKMSPPHYQPILNSEIPTASLPDGQGAVRVIAGDFAGM